MKCNLECEALMNMLFGQCMEVVASFKLWLKNICLCRKVITTKTFTNVVHCLLALYNANKSLNLSPGFNDALVIIIL